jgi:DNA-binding MarR family transcriptional regulator
MRRSSLEATVDDLETVLGIMRALRSGHRRNANRLPIYMYTILLAVAKRPEGTTMRDLRSELTLSHSSVTRACLAMDSEGLVRISRARTDRRRKLVALTQKGNQVIDEVLTALRGSRR